jgi:hypothetical protein
MQMQKLNIISKRSLKSLSIVTCLLAITVIFSRLLHRVLDWLLVYPVFSSIQTSIWADLSFLILWGLLSLAIINLDYKKTGRQYIFQGCIAVAVLFYLFHRIDALRYTFTQFSKLPGIKYADIMATLPLLYLILLNVRRRKYKPEITNEKNRPAQNVITSYLVQNTNYALLINGKRGTGKTYFMKNTVQPMIDRTLAYGQSSVTYKTILISLYGVKNIDEIYFSLAINIKPYLKHLSVQSGSVLARILSRGLINLSGAGSIDDFTGDIRNAMRENAQISSFVLVFDDLDRIADGFSAHEFIGFVNSLVEHENNKVLIVVDELKIEQKLLYNAAKEKSIGRVIDFPNDFEASLSEIINSRYKAEIRYLEALKTLEGEILKVFKHWKCDNLRTLIYFLNHFEQIFKHIDSMSDEDELRLSKLTDAAEYCAVFSIEFSKGDISFSSPEGLNEPGKVNSYLTLQSQVNSLRAKRLAEKENKDQPVSKTRPYVEDFAQNFSRKNFYYFYQSIFDYVTGGNELDKELLSQELKENITDRIFKPSEEELVFQKLNYPVFYDLSPARYIELTQQMLQYATEGKYPLARYLEIYDRLTRYPEIKDWINRDTIKQLIDAMERNIDLYTHDPKLNVYNRHTNTDNFSVEEKEISAKIIEINNALGTRDSAYKRENLFSLFTEDPEKFYDTCNSEYVQKPVFDTWNFPVFLAVFRAMKPSEVLEFNAFFKARYGYMEKTDWVEYEFISALFDELRKFPEENMPFTFRLSLEDELSNLIIDFIMRYQQQRSKEIQL